MPAMYTGTKVEFYTGTTLNGAPCNFIPVQQFVNLPSTQNGMDGLGTSVKFQIGPEGFLSNPKAAWPADGKIFLACLFTAQDPKAICPRNDALNDWKFPQIGSASNYVTPNKSSPPTQHTLPIEGIAKQAKGYLYSQEVEVKAGGTAFDVQIDLGLAGGNHCWFFFGESSQYERGNVRFENWRKVEYELIYPSIMSYAFEKNSRGHMDFSSDIRIGISDVFREVFIDVSCLGSQAITDEEVCGLVVDDDDLFISHSVCLEPAPLHLDLNTSYQPTFLKTAPIIPGTEATAVLTGCKTPGAQPRFIDSHTWSRSTTVVQSPLKPHQVRLWTSHILLDDLTSRIECASISTQARSKLAYYTLNSMIKRDFAAFLPKTPAIESFYLEDGIWECVIDPQRHKKNMKYCRKNDHLFLSKINTVDTCRVSEINPDGTEGAFIEFQAKSAKDVSNPSVATQIVDLAKSLNNSVSAYRHQGVISLCISWTASVGVPSSDPIRSQALDRLLQKAFQSLPKIPIHPGLNISGLPRIGSLEKKWIGSGTTVTSLEIVLSGRNQPGGPPSPEELVGPETDTTCPISWKLEADLVNGLPGISLPGTPDLFLSMFGSNEASISLITHELGHKMGMAPFINGTDDRVGNPPGMPTPLHVDNGGHYYRDGKSNRNGLRNNSHKGPHCNGTALNGDRCTMFGLYNNAANQSIRMFCPNCLSFLQSRDLSDIHSRWEGRY